MRLKSRESLSFYIYFIHFSFITCIYSDCIQTKWNVYCSVNGRHTVTVWQYSVCNVVFCVMFYVPFRPLAFTEVKFNEKNDDDERVEMTCPFDSLSVQTNDNNFPLFFRDMCSINKMQLSLLYLCVEPLECDRWKRMKKPNIIAMKKKNRRVNLYPIYFDVFSFSIAIQPLRMIALGTLCIRFVYVCV